MRFNVFHSTSRASVVVLALVLLGAVLTSCSSDLPEPGAAIEEADTASVDSDLADNDLADSDLADDDLADPVAGGGDENSESDSDDDSEEDDDPVVIDPDWLGSTNSRSAAVQLARGLLQPCGAVGTSFDKQIANAPDQIRRDLEQVKLKLQAMRTACNSTEEAFREATTAAIAEVGDFANANVNPPPVFSIGGLEGLPVATELLLTYEWGAWALSGGVITSHSSVLWLNRFHRGHLASMLRSPDGEPAEPGGVVVTGGTQALYGLVPSLIAGDNDAYNAALPGGNISFGGWIGDQVVPSVQPDTVVIGISAAEYVAPPGSECASVDASPFETIGERGLDILADAPGLDGYTLAEILADPSAKRLDLAPRSVVYQRTFDAVGDFTAYPEFTDEVLETRNDRRLESIETWTVCDGQLDHLGETVESLSLLGIDVVAVLMPLHSELREAAGGPGPDGGFAAFSDQVAEALGATDVIDLTTEIGDDQFLDLTLLGEAGAAEVSAAVAAAIG